MSVAGRHSVNVSSSRNTSVIFVGGKDVYQKIKKNKKYLCFIETIMILGTQLKSLIFINTCISTANLPLCVKFTFHSQISPTEIGVECRWIFCTFNSVSDMQGLHILNEISFLFCMKTIPDLFSYISVIYGQMNLPLQ